MVSFTFTDDGGIQTMINTIREMENNIEPVASRRLAMILDEGKALMQDIVHKITGNLMASIGTSIQGLHGEIFALAFYAAIEEYREGNHSYFRPGVEHIKARLPEVVMEDISNYLQTRSGQSAIARR
jgi:hypothetical protein